MRRIFLVFPLFVVSLLLSPPLAGVSAARGGDIPAFRTAVPFAKAVSRLQEAIRANKMGIVSRANAQAGAASIGKKIKGNQVFGVYRPDFAVRMLEASVPAGFEAPIRIYIYENPDGTATLTYKKPSDVFRPYGSPKLDEMAAELDAIFARIVKDALGGR